MTEEMFERVYALNVKAPYFLVAELAPLMAKKGKGAIVNLSTMVADYGAPGRNLYGSSKAAINLLTKVWAAEYGPSGVRVNAVSPGPTRTEGTEAMGEGLEKLAAEAPAGRPATPDEIAEAIVFWPRIVPVLFTAQNWPSMGVVAPFEIVAAKLRPGIAGGRSDHQANVANASRIRSVFLRRCGPDDYPFTLPRHNSPARQTVFPSVVCYTYGLGAAVDGRNENLAIGLRVEGGKRRLII